MGVIFDDHGVDQDKETGEWFVTYTLECAVGHHRYATVRWPIEKTEGREAKVAQMDRACLALMAEAESKYPIFWYMATKMKDLGAHWATPRYLPVTSARGVKLWEEEIGWPGVRATVSMKKSQYESLSSVGLMMKSATSVDVARVNMMRSGMPNRQVELYKIPVTTPAGVGDAVRRSIALEVFTSMMREHLAAAIHTPTAIDQRPERMKSAAVSVADFFYKKYGSPIDTNATRITKTQSLEAFCVANVVGGDTLFHVEDQFKMRSFITKVRRASL